MPARQTKARLLGEYSHTGRLLPSATVVGRSQRLTRGVRLAVPLASTSPRRPRAELANPAGPQAANTRPALNPSPPVVSVDTIPLAPMAPVLPKTLTFVFSGLLIASRRSTFLELPNAPRVAFCQRANLSGIGAKILVMHFCCFVCAHCIITIWRNGLVPWMLMVNKRLQKFSCRLAVQDQVS
jgi:hypothetical protein